MRYKVLVEGPALTQSGYGEHTRLVLRSLREREDVLDIYMNPLNWGTTSWLLGESEERSWLDRLMQKTAAKNDSDDKHFDIQIHVGIPNEFERKANYCVCVTAGVETTKVSPNWIEKSYSIDKIVVPSEFSKWVFENTNYTTKDNSGNEIQAGCGAAVSVVPYPVRTLEKDENFNLDLEYDDNFLIVAQWALRKNLDNTIKWFLEEFKNDKVGLVIKTNTAKNCYIDRKHTEARLRNLLDAKEFQDRKCKIYLVHGDLSKEELNSLYCHSKIKALISATHGEGYGLPIFEAAYNGLPVLAPGWSGHLDFLYGEIKDKKNKLKRKALFARIDYVLAPVQKDAVWKDIIVQDSMWCYPNKVDFKRKLRQIFTNHKMYLSWAKKLKEQILKSHTEKNILEKMRNTLLPTGVLEAPEYIFVSDMFQGQYAGGAEMSLQTLMDNSPNESVAGINSHYLSEELIEPNKKAKWVFGNISQLSADTMEKIAEHNLDYTFVEFDYKYCKHRNPLLYKMVEGEECVYADTELGKRMAKFMNGANSVFFMSKEQMDLHKKHLPDFDNKNTFVLSSLFPEPFFKVVEELRSKHKSSKNNKWMVMGSNSWVKGVQESEDWCRDNGLEYELIQGVPPAEFLQKLSSFKGVCFKPGGLDTCPRLIIEAKLLGCELELNENVQHVNEEWFNSEYDQMIAYLKSRPSFFWEKAF